MQTNKARSATTAILLALAVIAPAGVLLLITYYLSGNETISSTIFFGTFLADLIGACWWISRRTAPAGQRVRMSIHQFIAHMKMHPELTPPGMTEFDLECFRKLQRRQAQAGLDAWLMQFRGAAKTARPSSQPH
jgi:hypothetical protein